jgi:hypothetical protein
MKKPVKIVLGVVGVIIVISIIASASSNSSGKLAEGGNSGGSNSIQPATFKAGDAIEFDSKIVTVSPAERNWNSGNQFIAPASGNEFIKVQVTIQNNSKSEASYNTFDWKLQDSKGVIKDVASAAYGVDGALSSGQLAPGGKVSGFLVFEASAGDTGLTLRYEPSFWSDKKVEIKL